MALSQRIPVAKIMIARPMLLTNNTEVRSVSFPFDATAVRSMGPLGIMGTLGVKEAGCGQRTGRLIGGMAQDRVFVDLGDAAASG